MPQSTRRIRAVRPTCCSNTCDRPPALPRGRRLKPAGLSALLGFTGQETPLACRVGAPRLLSDGVALSARAVGATPRRRAAGIRRRRPRYRRVRTGPHGRDQRPGRPRAEDVRRQNLSPRPPPRRLMDARQRRDVRRRRQQATRRGLRVQRVGQAVRPVQERRRAAARVVPDPGRALRDGRLGTRGRCHRRRRRRHPHHHGRVPARSWPTASR